MLSNLSEQIIKPAVPNRYVRNYEGTYVGHNQTGTEHTVTVGLAAWLIILLH